MKKLILLPALFIAATLFLQSPRALQIQVLAADTCLQENAACTGNPKCCDGLTCNALKCVKTDSLKTPGAGGGSAKCKCRNPEKAEDGKNAIDCDNGKSFFCPDNHQACFNDPNGKYHYEWEALGVRCAEPEKKDDKKDELPQPPKPPCKDFNDKGGCKTINTGLGDLQTETGPFISKIFAILLSLSGGIALLLIIKAGYQIMTSHGKPESLQQGRDQLIAAIVGLLFLIFSFVLLQTIGVDILKIPELTGK